MYLSADEIVYERHDLVSRVAAGARVLDERKPDWANLIDTDALDMFYYTSCVLGQLGGYEAHKQEFGWSEDHSIDHGFYLPDADEFDGEPYDVWHEESYKLLTNLWREQINARLAAA